MWNTSPISRRMPSRNCVFHTFVVFIFNIIITKNQILWFIILNFVRTVVFVSRTIVYKCISGARMERKKKWKIIINILCKSTGKTEGTREPRRIPPRWVPYVFTRAYTKSYNMFVYYITESRRRRCFYLKNMNIIYVHKNVYLYIYLYTRFV